MSNFQVQHWPLYIALSFFVNAWILNSIRMDTNTSISYEFPSIKVTLMSVAAPVVQFKPSFEKNVNSKSVIQNNEEVASEIKVETKENVKEKINRIVEHKKPAKISNHKNRAKNTSKSLLTQLEQSLTEKTFSYIKPPKVASLDPNIGKTISTTIHKAKYRIQIPPTYPRRSYELGQEGTVILIAQVSINGKPRALEVEESSGYRLLDSAAIAAVKKWEFEPIKVNEQSIASWVRVPVRFVIQ